MSHLIVHRVASHCVGYMFPTEFRGYYFTATSTESVVMHFRNWEDITRAIHVLNPGFISISAS